MKRRSFVFGLAAGLAAPAVVRAASLMPVSAVDPYAAFRFSAEEVRRILRARPLSVHWHVLDEASLLGRFDPRSLFMLPPKIGSRPLLHVQSIRDFVP